MRRSAILLVLLAACATPDGQAATTTAPVGTTATTSTTAAPSGSGCADVVDATATRGSDGTWRFDVTVASADTGWDKYADAWEVRLPDGTVAGTRELAHPHVDEQPFTRSLSGVELPDGVDRVTIAARDSVEGFCGETLEVATDTPS